MAKKLNVEKGADSEIIDPSAAINEKEREESEIIDGEDADKIAVKISKQKRDKSMSTSYENVIPDTEQTTKKKRLWTTRRVSVLTEKKMNKKEQKSSESESDEEEEHYYDYTVWKFGCPKCDDTCHSKAGYVQELQDY